jgi:hypothetical protein
MAELSSCGKPAELNAERAEVVGDLNGCVANGRRIKP